MNPSQDASLMTKFAANCIVQNSQSRSSFYLKESESPCGKKVERLYSVSEDKELYGFRIQSTNEEVEVVEVFNLFPVYNFLNNFQVESVQQLPEEEKR